MKILCTGNPHKATIANSIAKVFNNVDFVHLSNGYDFKTEIGLKKFENIIDNYDVFINASRIDTGIQIKLLKIIHNRWHQGHVINIGSTMEFHFFNHIDPVCAEDKLNLRKLSLDMYNENFRTTHLQVGGFKDRSSNGHLKMDSIHIANTIQWILHQSPHFHIAQISVENDFWNKGQEGAGCNWQELKNKGRDLTLYD